IRAIRPFHDEEADVDRVPGDEWLFVGPGTYEVIDSIKAIIIQTGEALQLRATRGKHELQQHALPSLPTFAEFITPDGVERKAGEEWLVRKSGAYMPQVEEEVVNKLKATVLTDKIALYLRAARDFVDVYGIERKAGEEWLVTKDMATHHITDVDEEMVDRVHLTTLTNRQYCVVCDPIIKGVQKLGTRQMRK
ncbi:mvpA, partial [Symbiodinium sp. KB8]